MDKARYLVNLHGGGTVLVTDEEQVEWNDAGRSAEDLSGYPLGSDCLRNYPELKPYAYKQPLRPERGPASKILAEGRGQND